MAFKIPTAEEIRNVPKTSGYTVPSLFKSSKAVAAEQKITQLSHPVSSIPSEVDSALNEDLVIKQARLCSDQSDESSLPTVSTEPSGSLKTSDGKIAEKGDGVLTKPVGSGVVIRPVDESEKPIVRQPKGNSIVVSPKQKGNPVLKFIRNVPWEYGDIVPDYQFSPTSCALFLSVRYHNLKPNYIHERLRQLANSYVLRVLLVHVDVKDCDFTLKELAKICLLADCTMVLAFTQEEAGRYIEIYKSFENKPAEMLMEKTDNNYLAKITDTLTSVKQINKTNAATLISAFGSFKKIAEASEKDLSLCPGMGPQKASRLHKVLHQPFLKEHKKPVTENATVKVAEKKS